MTHINKEEIRIRIEKEIKETKDAISQLENTTDPIEPDNAIGRLSRMEALNSKAVSEASLEASRKKLLRLQYALKQIDSEDFGYCDHCGNPIPEKRILLMPDVRRCIECAA